MEKRQIKRPDPKASTGAYSDGILMDDSCNFSSSIAIGTGYHMAHRSGERHFGEGLNRSVSQCG